MDALACIYMYHSIERNIMKIQSSSLGIAIQGRIFPYICFIFYALANVYFLFLQLVCSLYRVKTYKSIKLKKIS